MIKADLLKVDLLMLKSILERIADIIKLEGSGTEPSGPLASSTDSPTKTYSTESPTLVGGPKRTKITVKDYRRNRDYAYGQKGKNEAGRTKPGVTSLPSEQPVTRTNPWTDVGTPYVDSH